MRGGITMDKLAISSKLPVWDEMAKGPKSTPQMYNATIESLGHLEVYLAIAHRC